jgi:hypothetical protein
MAPNEIERVVFALDGVVLAAILIVIVDWCSFKGLKVLERRGNTGRVYPSGDLRLGRPRDREW